MSNCCTVAAHESTFSVAAIIVSTDIVLDLRTTTIERVVELDSYLKV